MSSLVSQSQDWGQNTSGYTKTKRELVLKTCEVREVWLALKHSKITFLLLFCLHSGDIRQAC